MLKRIDNGNFKEEIILNQPTFFILDVFAEEKYSGNQLAVFKDVEGLSDKEMQDITREINFSETTFILSNKGDSGSYPVRIFTPAQEIPFGGHPTIGTAFVIQEEFEKGQADTISLDLKAGTIPVRFMNEGEKQVLWMKQNNPEFGQEFQIEELAEILGIAREDFDMNHPIQFVSTGLPSIIVPLKTLESVKSCKVNLEKYETFMKERQATLLVFSPETYNKENDLNARVFCHYLGIPEDPATGSAIGNLAGYLVRNRYYDGHAVNIKVEQGFEINRPSILMIKADKEEESISVQVGGSVKLIAKGSWMV